MNKKLSIEGRLRIYSKAIACLCLIFYIATKNLEFILLMLIFCHISIEGYKDYKKFIK